MLGEKVYTKTIETQIANIKLIMHEKAYRKGRNLYQDPVCFMQRLWLPSVLHRGWENLNIFKINKEPEGAQGEAPKFPLVCF